MEPRGVDVKWLAGVLRQYFWALRDEGFPESLAGELVLGLQEKILAGEVRLVTAADVIEVEVLGGESFAIPK